MLNSTSLKHKIRQVTIKHLSSAQLFALCIFLILSFIGCGKRKPPAPPRERVPQRVELSGYQRGNKVILSWRMPARNAGPGSLNNIDRIDIYRLAEPASADLSMSEEEFASRSTVIASLKIHDDDFGLKTLIHSDELQFAGQAARLRYSMRFANSAGQKAAFSNFLVIEPTAKIAQVPTSLSGLVGQDEIRLSWEPPNENVDGSTPASVTGYNVYRSDSTSKPAVLLNKVPVDYPTFDDHFFEFGKKYFYFVRAVSSGVGADPIESGESNILKVEPFDTFPPSPPSAISLASGTSVISIFFAINPEQDVAGYKIYRSTDPDLELKQWEDLTKDLLKTNTFQDTRVTAGETYYYYLTATDIRQNVSDPSDIVSDTVR